MEELSIQFFPPGRTNSAPLKSVNKEAEGPSSYDGYAGSRDGRLDLEGVGVMKYDSIQSPEKIGNPSSTLFRTT